MHSFFAGFLGFVMGVSSFFHGGHGLLAHFSPSSLTPTPSASISAVPNPSGFMQRGFGRGEGENLPVGQRPFFGTVIAVNGNNLTVQRMIPGRFFMHPSVTPSVSPSPQVTTLTIVLDTNTKYVGGSASSIVVSTQIAVVGKVTSDGTLTATVVRINANLPGPTGFRHMPQGRPEGNDDAQNH